MGAALQILLVDDDPFVRDVAVTALSAVRGVRVEACAGGAQALAALEDFTPDLVVLDLMMPGMDGCATWTAIWAAMRKRGGPVPRLVFLTGRDDQASREDFTALGASGLIVKPFNPRTLAAEVLGFADAAAVRAIRLEAVARDFAGSLPATLSVIDTAWRTMAAGWQISAAETLLTEVHRIAGVAAMFQFQRLGDAADKVEALMLAALKSGGWSGQAQRAQVEGAVRALMAEGAAVNA
jgi:CheY-like chemotaxis protein